MLLLPAFVLVKAMLAYVLLVGACSPCLGLADKARGVPTGVGKS